MEISIGVIVGTCLFWVWDVFWLKPLYESHLELDRARRQKEGRE